MQLVESRALRPTCFSLRAPAVLYSPCSAPHQSTTGRRRHPSRRRTSTAHWLPWILSELRKVDQLEAAARAKARAKLAARKGAGG